MDETREGECAQMKSFIIFLLMDENFHSLLVDGQNKRGEKFCIVRDKGRANQKLENVLTEVMCTRMQATAPGLPYSN
jgi:hypothetical protein